jgi:hypothetical protein
MTDRNDPSGSTCSGVNTRFFLIRQAHAGGVLLTRAAVAGLQEGLSAGLARWRAPRAVHDLGKMITDLAVTPALGGGCLADAAVLRAHRPCSVRWPWDQPGISQFGAAAA